MPSDEQYQFDPGDLDCEDEQQRRWAIIYVSRYRLTDFEDRLISMLSSEKSTSNRRHIVRALGNLGSIKSIPHIRSILSQHQGLILGEAAEALGKLMAHDARTDLEQLVHSPIQSIKNKAKWALKQLSN